MDVPLTASGQFDSDASGSIDNVAWGTVKGSSPLSETGSNRGVVLVSLLTKKLVLKSSQEPAREMFLTRLCRHLGVAAPACRFVLAGSDEYVQISQRVRGLTTRPVFVIQEYVEGTTLSQIRMRSNRLPGGASPAPLFSAESPGGRQLLRALGRIMCLDVFTNNWDRIPLIHHNAGNFGNVILQYHGEEARLVAIDNAMTGIRKFFGPNNRNRVYDEYCNTVENLVKAIVFSGPGLECPQIQNVRGLLNARCALELTPKDALVIQMGVAEMFVRLADFDKFAEEKEIVAGLCFKNAWYDADLERIDLVFLEDMHNIAKRHKDEILKKYKFV